MCGRYTRKYTWRQIHEFLSLTLPRDEELFPSFNVAPTQDAPIVRLDDGRRPMLTMARWGLIPSWAKDIKIGNSMINARAETIAGKPAFRSAFEKRRCVVPVSGFYEWQRRADGTKQPWHIQRADGQIMCFAGLHEQWRQEDKRVESFTIITTEANEFMTPLHDRMPVILEPEEIQAWLDPQTPASRLSSMLDPAPAGVLTAHRVSTRVNSPKVDEPALVDPVGE
jgi:putative SOS response-associated peptidase YedK